MKPRIRMRVAGAEGHTLSAQDEAEALVKLGRNLASTAALRRALVSASRGARVIARDRLASMSPEYREVVNDVARTLGESEAP